MNAMMKSELPDPGRQLVELMQSINFGRIENLPVRGGLPILNPSPRVIREIKFGGENGPRPERSASDFALKAQVADFFDQLVRIGHGTIEVLEIKHGLPFRMMIAE
jgi:hypothetical protein